MKRTSSQHRSRHIWQLAILAAVFSACGAVPARGTEPSSPPNDAFTTPEQESQAYLQSRTERLPYLVAGDRELVRLRPAHAARAYQHASSFPRRLPNGSIWRFNENQVIARAVRGLARTYAERGDFRKGRQWLLDSLHYPEDGCGVGAFARSDEVRTTARVWAEADTDTSATIPALERFVRKETQIIDPPQPTGPGGKLNWEFIAATEASRRDFAAREARLLLAEFQQKRGNRDAARARFKALCPDAPTDRDDEITRLARAHLEEHHR